MNNPYIPQVPKFQEKPRLANYSSLNQLAMYQPHLADQLKAKSQLVPSFEKFQMEEETSNRVLPSPNLQLVGKRMCHQGEVYCVKFSPNGELLATAGFDRKIFLWDIYNNCKNVGILGECLNAILDVQWSIDGTRLFTASADKTAVVWDMERFQSIKKLKGHTSYVNSVSPSQKGPEILVSGGDDGSTKLWDLRTKRFQMQFEGKYPVTSVVLNEQGDKIYTGSLDNTIKCYDLKRKDIEYQLNSHADTITGLSLSNDGSYLLSNSMDMTVRVFDVRSFVTGKNRQIRIFTGATHNASEKNLLRCAWSPDGQHVISGSADRYLYIWDYNSKKLVHRLGGHTGTVTEAVFSPRDRIMASSSSDKTVIIGEIPEVGLA